MASNLHKLAEWMRRVGYSTKFFGDYAVECGEEDCRIRLECAPRPAVEFTLLWVAPRLRGTGRSKEMARWLCHGADEHCIILRAWARPVPPAESYLADPHTLAAWYAVNWGFAPVYEESYGPDDCAVRIVRWPGATS